jgi:DNA-binding NarL/FixJ family response regulator
VAALACSAPVGKSLITRRHFARCARRASIVAWLALPDRRASASAEAAVSGGTKGGAMGGSAGDGAGVPGAPERPEPIRTLIVDDHALFRRGLEMVLDAEQDIELVGEASDGDEAVEKAGESLPDIVLMDIRMPRSSGIEACRAMKEVVPSAKIIILTISDEEEDLFEAIRAGASGYLLKDIPLDEVAETVRAVHGGQSLINPSMAGKLLTEFATLARRDEEERIQRIPAPRLTEREMQVLKLVARGMNNRDIAKELFISDNTVKNHVRNILEKLQIHSRMEAVMVAVRDKLIEFG